MEDLKANDRAHYMSKGYKTAVKDFTNKGEIDNDALSVYVANIIHKHILDVSELIDDTPVIYNAREYKKYKFKDIEFYSDGWTIRSVENICAIIPSLRFANYFKICIEPV